MSYPLKKEEGKADRPQSGQEITSESSEAGLKPGAVEECRDNISIGDLRTFLFNLKDGLEADAAIARHFEAGCPVCELRRMQLEATTPYLYGWLEPKFLAAEELPPRPGQAVTPEQLEPNPVQTGLGGVTAPSSQPVDRSSADWCAKLAGFIKAPTDPHTLKQLDEWSREVRLIPQAEREMFAQYISAQCQGRWRRLDSGLQDSAKTTAEQLLTAVLGGAARFEPDEDPQSGEKHDVRRLPKDLAGQEAERAFLDYMMSHIWFLNADGESVWGVSESGSGERHVVLYFDVLRQALHTGQEKKLVETTYQNHV